MQICRNKQFGRHLFRTRMLRNECYCHVIAVSGWLPSKLRALSGIFGIAVVMKFGE